MSQIIKTLCQTLHRSKLIEICDKMGACDWEREVILELYAEPRRKNLDNMTHIRKDQFYKKVPYLEQRIISLLSERGSEILSYDYLKNMFLFFVKISNEKPKETP